ncbi:MAG: hypothetical protein LBQ77_07865, partial [Treponema sp.]|nr:hypothetical protein [Treponema sp.]
FLVNSESFLVNSESFLVNSESFLANSESFLAENHLRSVPVCRESVVLNQRSVPLSEIYPR